MLHHSLLVAKHEIGVPVRVLKLHADNCGGQHKNKLILWIIAWRVIDNLEREVTLFFMIPGHTKNRFDGAFGFCKRKTKQFNVVTPRDLVNVVQESSETNRAQLFSEVECIEWKAGEYF